MGDVVGAGLLAHVPTIMLPEADRRALNHGKDTTLVEGLRRLRREVFDVLDYDTVVVLDTHGPHGRVRRRRSGPALGSIHRRGAPAGDVPRPL
jgi:hypothetical protein